MDKPAYWRAHLQRCRSSPLLHPRWPRLPEAASSPIPRPASAPGKHWDAPAGRSNTIPARTCRLLSDVCSYINWTTAQGSCQDPGAVVQLIYEQTSAQGSCQDPGSWSKEIFRPTKCGCVLCIYAKNCDTSSRFMNRFPRCKRSSLVFSSSAMRYGTHSPGSITRLIVPPFSLAHTEPARYSRDVGCARGRAVTL